MAYAKSVIFLARDKINYYDTSLAAPLTFAFSKDFINDLEVVNSVSLHLQIKSFIDNHKISPAQVVLVLSPDVYFGKDFPDNPEFHQDIELQKFIDTVPFENASTKIYKLATGSKLLATNADMYQNIKAAFEKAGFVIEAVVPIFILGKDIPIADQLDVSSAKTILERFDLAKQNSLLINQDLYPRPQNLKDKKGKKDDNRSLIFLLPILFTLIIVLIIFYLKTSTSTPTPQLIPTPTIFLKQENTLPSVTSTAVATPTASLNQDNISTPDSLINQPKP